MVFQVFDEIRVNVSNCFCTTTVKLLARELRSQWKTLLAIKDCK
jgi:hypothetical protein